MNLSLHAQGQMLERKIKVEWVEAVMRAPEFVRIDKIDKKVTLAFARIPDAGDRWLRVVYKTTESETFVITTFLDRKAEKWR